MNRANPLRAMSGLCGIPPGALPLAILIAVGAGGACARASVAEIPRLAAAPTLKAGESAEIVSALASIQLARDAGLAWLAEDLAATALAGPAIPRAARDQILITLADVRLQRAAYGEAADALSRITTAPPAKTLRLGLIAYAQGRIPEAEAQLNATPTATGDEDDKVWRTTLEGLLECERGATQSGIAKLDRARREARHPSIAAQLAILRLRAIMRIRPEGTDPLTEIGNLLEILPDARQTYQLGKTQAFALHRAGRRAEALRRLDTLPVQDKDLRAERDLIAGVIAGGRSPEGRKALLAAIDATGYKDIQSLALEALTEAVVGAPRYELIIQANQVYTALTERVDSDRGSDIADRIHLTRARIMLLCATGATDPVVITATREKASAALDEIISKYPNSPVINEALLLAAETAVSAGANRKAAVAFEQLASRVKPSETPDLHLLAADCYRNNQDYAAAAAAYAAAGKGLNNPDRRGAALLGEISSLLKASRTAEAAVALNAAGGISPETRLRASWHVADALRADGDTRAAMAMVTAALEGTPTPAPATRLRFLWLRALLELASSEATKATATAGEIATIASAADLPAEIRDHAPAILAQTALLRARAALAAGDNAGAGSGFKSLREQHPDSVSAAASYVVEGRHLAALGNHSGALSVFRTGYETYRRSSNELVLSAAHDALFAAAIEALALAEKRGEKLREAFELLDTLTKDPAAKTHFHRARLMQGDILRLLNEFDSAEKLYEDLSRTLPNHQDRLRADIARADCLLEKADLQPNFNPVAAAEYERLYNLPGRPADLAAEAGYKRALAVSRSQVKGSLDELSNIKLARREAAKLLWVQTETILREAAALGPRGRHWLARSFLLLAELEEKDGHLADARAALRRILDLNAGQPDPSRRLPGGDLARQRLELLSRPSPLASGTP